MMGFFVLSNRVGFTGMVKALAKTINGEYRKALKG